MAGRTCAVGLLLPVLLLAGCESGADPVAVPTPSPSAAPGPPASSPSPSAPASAQPAGLVLAVTRQSGGLELFRVDPRTAAAQPERVLDPPVEGARAVDVTLSARLTCATWRMEAATATGAGSALLACYAPGSAEPQRVPGVEEPDRVALTDDGTQIAWSRLPDGSNPVLSTARLEGARATSVRTILGYADQPAEQFIGTGAQDLAWADPEHLVVSTSAESDDDPRLLLVDLGDVTRGWLADGAAVPMADRAYYAYDSVDSADGRTAHAVQRGSWMDQGAPPARAVRIDLGTGRVEQVVATAAAGRDVVAVTGDEAVTFYGTATRGDQLLTVYLRLSGEPRGRPVSGLPADVTHVTTDD